MLKIRIEKIIGFGYFNFNMDNVTKNISYFSIRANYTYSNSISFFHAESKRSFRKRTITLKI